MTTNPNDAIQSLSRIIAAAARLMASMHLHGKPVDFNEELDHMQANLDCAADQIARFKTGEPR